MSQPSKNEYFRIMHARYQRARAAADKSEILNELCAVCGYHRKPAIRKLNRPLPPSKKKCRHKPRGTTYNAKVISVLKAVWEAAGYPWSLRLKALLPVWLVWIRLRFALTAEQERQLLAISPRQIDRRLHPHKLELKRRRYGRTKPGTLLKHQVPIRTEHWDVTTPGSVEIDLVSHSGSSAEGEFIYSLNLTDIFTGWTTTRAVMGKGQRGVVTALDAMAAELPFALQAIDSDNGSEFLNAHLIRYCRQRNLKFTRSRPYKKDDNAHIEQKNWTHVRKLIGYDRFDLPRALAAMNDLYTHEWSTMMNLFQPSVKLIRKVRNGARLTRHYDAAQTPLDRLLAAKCGNAAQLAVFVKSASRPIRSTSPRRLSVKSKRSGAWPISNKVRMFRPRLGNILKWRDDIPLGSFYIWLDRHPLRTEFDSEKHNRLTKEQIHPWQKITRTRFMCVLLEKGSPSVAWGGDSAHAPHRSLHRPLGDGAAAEVLAEAVNPCNTIAVSVAPSYGYRE